MRRSTEISALKTREARSWKVIDWCQSSACKNPKVKFEAAKFVLERLYPVKTIHAGDAENPIQLKVYLPENKAFA